ncbi:MAG: VTT domain-containing protein [Actinomycetota bacterium]|nr:VTT domain-containing protein [Actinomycetota bacterium]
MLLAGGYLAHTGDVPVWAIAVAGIPMQVLAVWLYFALGRVWAADLERDDRLPFIAARILRPAKVRALREALREGGLSVVATTRFAIFPTGLIAAAAGASGLDPPRYILADGAASAVTTVLALGCGYGLGVAYDRAGPWLAAIGLCGLVAVTTLVTLLARRRLQANEQRHPSDPASTSHEVGDDDVVGDGGDVGVQRSDEQDGDRGADHLTGDERRD